MALKSACQPSGTPRDVKAVCVKRARLRFSCCNFLLLLKRITQCIERNERISSSKKRRRNRKEMKVRIYKFVNGYLLRKIALDDVYAFYVSKGTKPCHKLVTISATPYTYPFLSLASARYTTASLQTSPLLFSLNFFFSFLFIHLQYSYYRRSYFRPGPNVYVWVGIFVCLLCSMHICALVLFYVYDTRDNTVRG